ncbi:MAG: phospho-N-acetylmuramoyl-pentapeptide-transferase [Bacteroidales bacterium]|nr:phospho-N-acetylmuramoyl-pentapeptide-transferase [Bacteroidales bacterium]
MLYYLFTWLQKIGLPGSRMFQYISFRSALAFVFSLIISIWIGKYFIGFLRRKQIGETIRELGLEGQSQKAGTPTMGGIIIIAAILIPVLLLCKLHNIYVLLMIFTTVWLGALGFSDDYIKVFKKNKEGLSPRTKLLGQILLGILVGAVVYFHPDAKICEKSNAKNAITPVESAIQISNSDVVNTHNVFDAPHHSTKTTIPFIKNNEFDYAWFTRWLGDTTGKWSFIIYILIVVFIIAAVSNGANLTDGLDGLATGTTSVIAVGIALLAYVSGNVIFANYLNIMYLPNIGELVIFISAVIGACIGFYWWNCYPAQIFMGDTGSLTLGGIVAVSCIIIRKEFLIPILCGIYLAEAVSVLIQRYYFKYTKKRYGEGRRVFLMSPLHHHYQKKGVPEPKIVQHFIVIGLLLAVLTLVTLKVR